MAIGQILQFSGATIDKYDAVRQSLDGTARRGSRKESLRMPQARRMTGSASSSGGVPKVRGTSSSLKGWHQRSRRSAAFRNRK